MFRSIFLDFHKQRLLRTQFLKGIKIIGQGWHVTQAGNVTEQLHISVLREKSNNINQSKLKKYVSLEKFCIFVVLTTFTA